MYLAVSLLEMDASSVSMGRWISRHLVIDALNMAISQRLPEGALIHHSDRKYTSDDFRDALKKHGIDCSMSARGNCYACESGREFLWVIETRS